MPQRLTMVSTRALGEWKHAEAEVRAEARLLGEVHSREGWASGLTNGSSHLLSRKNAVCSAAFGRTLRLRFRQQ